MEQLHQPTHTTHAEVPLDSPVTGFDVPPFGTVPQSPGQVDVAAAKQAFSELERQLSRTAANSNVDGQDNEEKRHEKVNPSDVEKGEVEHFDLRDYMHSNNEANEAAGIAHKRVGVSWEGLEVIVAGGTAQKFFVRTFGQALYEFALFPYFWATQAWNMTKPKDFSGTRKLLEDFNGVLRPGEMCLVLGRPGSGCSTFLKAIANRREDYLAVNGNVSYAGIPADEMARTFAGEVVYNQEDDVHVPTLTVAQTLLFALNLKTPAKRIPGVKKDAFNETLLQTLLKMFNMSHTVNTLVGNEFVRGVSGGERKRVSLAEMMTTRANVASWDNSTRGLDASTALDFARSLRIMTDIFQQTTFVSLYQASESIYKLFDKVMVIDSGRMVYYGGVQEARQYFVDLGFQDFPRQTTAEYLTGCTDPNERKFQPGRSESNVPSTPAQLADAFKSSKIYNALDSDRIGYNKLMETEAHDRDQFQRAVLEAKQKGVRRSSPYTVPPWKQAWVLTKRQFRLQSQDTFTLVTSYGMSSLLSLIVGLTFRNQPNTTAGGFTRGSILFIAMLTNCLDAFVELPTAMLSRPVLYKQTGYKLYRPSMVALANTLADLPFSASRLLIFDIIVYFLTGLARTPGAFFTFHLFVYMGFLILQGFFRLLGILCSNFDSAFRLGTFFIPQIINYAGYIIPVFRMQRWLFWIYYINPLNYAFQAMMENEFSRVDLECEGAYIVPRNGPGVTKYPDSLGPFQACTFFGAVPGQTTIDGAAYLMQGYEMDVKNLWRQNLSALIGFFLFFLGAQILALEVFHHAGGSGGTIFAKETPEIRALNEQLEERAKAKTKEDGNQRKQGLVLNGKPFTWESVDYIVPIKGGSDLQLLTDVYGYVKPGSLTALMGASGAGKTTCLDVLAQRKNIGVVRGDILVDGRPIPADFARSTAYAEQLDVHEGTATIREAMRFSAYLRQPASVSKEEKDAYVEDMIDLLELTPLADALVFTLSVEARKRLTIGVELASKPELLLFLDEPTSGLDSQSAWNLVRFLRKLADAGQAILCTIHQPSALLFESFDRLLLLQRGGRTVYFGEIGTDSYVVREYFAARNAHCPPDINMAEYMLEAIGAGVSPRVGDRDWADMWDESVESKEVRREIKRLKDEAIAQRPTHTADRPLAYATPIWYQIVEVTKRNLVALWRSPDYIFTRLFVQGFISLFVSLTLLDLGHSVRDVQYRVFGIFWVSVLPAIVMAQISPLFILNRMTYIREASSGIYSPYVFAIGQLVGEIPYNVLCGLLYWVLMVWPMGFGKGSEGTRGNGFHFLMILFVQLFGVSLGQAIAAISPSIKIASLYNPFLGLVLTTFAGVTAPYPTLPSYFRWVYELSPYTRILGGMLVTELKGLEIICKPDEFATFEPSTGQTCQEWAGEFVSSVGGYLDNPDATSACKYCQYRVGEEFYSGINLSFENRWRDLFLLLAFFGFNVVVTILASRWLRFAKR